MKNIHLEEKQTFGIQGVAMQKKKAANVIRGTRSDAGGAQCTMPVERAELEQDSGP
jgi:hypothetical protein